MNKQELVKEVARRTGIAAEYVGVVIDESISEIKYRVEKGEKVVIRDFLTLFLHHKEDFVATQFNTKDGRKHQGPYAVERKTYQGGDVPWVKVSRKWRNEVMRGPSKRVKSQEIQNPNQLELFNEK